MCACLFVTTLTASMFVHGSEIRYNRLLYDDFLDFDSQISLKRLCSRDMTLFASAVLDNTRNDNFES